MLFVLSVSYKDNFYLLTFPALMGRLFKSNREKSGVIYPVNLNVDNQHISSKTEQ